MKEEDAPKSPKGHPIDANGDEISEWFQWFDPGKPTPPPELGTPKEHGGMTPELAKWYGQNKRTRTKWKNGMTKQEIQARMSQASKLPLENEKYLDEETAERTGLELNPLWWLEMKLRSGTLSDKEAITVAKILADHTHSKAPSISHSTNVSGSPEDFLKGILESQKSEMKVIEHDDVHHPRVPNGEGPSAELKASYKKRKKRERDEVAYYGEAGPDGKGTD